MLQSGLYTRILDTVSIEIHDLLSQEGRIPTNFQVGIGVGFPVAFPDEEGNCECDSSFFFFPVNAIFPNCE